MTNEVQSKITIHVLQETDLNLDEYLNKFHESNIIDAKLVVTLPDGSVHMLSIYEIISGKIESFVVDDEEMIVEEEVVKPEKKITKLKSKVTEIAI